MTEETFTPPETGAATPVAESTPDAPAISRGADGKFTSQPQAAEPVATTDAAPDPVAQPEKTEKEEPKRSRARERIDELTAEKYAAQREAQTLRAQLEAIQKAPKPQVDPNDYDAMQREGMRSVVREERVQDTYQKLQEAAGRVQSAMVQTFQTKLEAARDRIPDLDKSIAVFDTLPVSDFAAEIIAESDVAAELAHYLANNPREAHKIATLSPAMQGRELARLETKLSLPSRRTTSAPPPPPSVTGATAAATRGPGEMSIAEMQSSLRKSGVIR